MDPVTIIFLGGSSFVIGLSGAMMPGPVMAMTIRETLSYRSRKAWLVGFMVAFGHSILEILLLAGLWLGAAVVLSHPVVTFLIGIAGGTVLIVFGLASIRPALASGEKLKKILDNGMDTGGEAGGQEKAAWYKHPLFKAMVFGFTLSATSAGWWLWWASIGLGSLTVAGIYVFSSMQAFLIFYFGHIASDIFFFTLLSCLAALGSHRINIKAYKAIHVATNVFLVVMGLLFIVQTLA